MFTILHALGIFVADLFKSRSRLEAENLFLRHQFNIALRPLCSTVTRSAHDDLAFLVLRHAHIFGFWKACRINQYFCLKFSVGVMTIKGSAHTASIRNANRGCPSRSHTAPPTIELTIANV